MHSAPFSAHGLFTFRSTVSFGERGAAVRAHRDRVGDRARDLGTGSGSSKKRHDKKTRGLTRTCVGCEAHDDPRSMVRLVVSVAEGNGLMRLAMDPILTKKRRPSPAQGRGAHVHAHPVCFVRAAKKGLPRSFRAPIQTNAESLARMVCSRAQEAIEELLLRAARERVIHRAQATGQATSANAKAEPCLYVVACDALELLADPDVTRAMAAGRAVAVGTKRDLGSLLSGLLGGDRQGDEIALLTVHNDPIAQALAHACAMANAVRTSNRMQLRRAVEDG